MLNTTEKSVVFLFAFIKILLYTKYGGFMKKVIYLNSNNVNLFYRKFRLYKFLSHFNINFIINYCGKEYTTRVGDNFKYDGYFKHKKQKRKI